MCGIAGMLYADPGRQVDPVVLRRMGDAIAHRGPDDDGYWIEPGIGLAHRRLSIVDLAGGDQPLGNEDGSVQVVFNGEIYNHEELRRRLIGRGHRFATHSDTEVLVHLYEEDGPRLVESLRGMFAFAFWDRRQRRLLLARDRVGIKPLYIYRDAEKLLFASELKPILAHPDVARDINPAAVEDYLALGMVPGARCIFRHVQKLPAAHWVCAEAGRLDQTSQCYWQLRYEPDTSLSLDDWRDAMDAKIDETVRAHRLADVPVGAFLSGGLDSTAIVATLAKQGVSGLRTFSIGFEDQRRSELPFARQVSRQFGTEHTEEIVSPQAASSLQELVRHYDEPFADSSAIPTLAVSRLAARSVKVVLSGDGGDEAFGGYSRYVHDLREDRIRRRLPNWFRRTVLRSLAAAWPHADWLPRPLRARNTFTNLSLDAAAAYANTVTLCRNPVRQSLLSPDVRRALAGHRPEASIERGYRTGNDPLSGMLAADTAVLLPDDFLTKVDRASMAYGLEVRPPFVDHELLELAARLPSSYKVRGGQTKWILKELFGPRLPADITQRPKQGFEIPLDNWMRGPLAGLFEETVLRSSSPVGDLIERSVAARLHRAHQSGAARNGAILWSLLVLGEWAATYQSSAGPVFTDQATPMSGRAMPLLTEVSQTP